MTEIDRLIEAITNAAANIICALMKKEQGYPEEPDKHDVYLSGGTGETPEQKTTTTAEHYSWAWWEAWINNGVKGNESTMWFRDGVNMLVDWKADRDEISQLWRTDHRALNVAEAELARVRKIAHELAEHICLEPFKAAKYAEIDGKGGA